MSDSTINAAIILLVRAGYTVSGPGKVQAPTQTATAPAAQEPHKCGTCGAVGHNARTCTKGQTAQASQPKAATAPAPAPTPAPAAPAFDLGSFTFDLGSLAPATLPAAPRVPQTTQRPQPRAAAPAPAAQKAPPAMPAGVASDSDLDALADELGLDNLIA